VVCSCPVISFKELGESKAKASGLSRAAPLFGALTELKAQGHGKDDENIGISKTAAERDLEVREKAERRTIRKRRKLNSREGQRASTQQTIELRFDQTRDSSRQRARQQLGPQLSRKRKRM
jgi:hypothetical protein